MDLLVIETALGDLGSAADHLLQARRRNPTEQCAAPSVFEGSFGALNITGGPVSTPRARRSARAAFETVESQRPKRVTSARANATHTAG
jgi:hypothetical protein